MEDLEKFLGQFGGTTFRFNRVTALFERFESAIGLDLLSTVHRVIDNEGAVSVSEAIEIAHAWIPRKAMLSKRQIEIAANRLESGGRIKNSAIRDS